MAGPTIEPSLFPGVTGDRRGDPKHEVFFGVPCRLGLCGFITNGDDDALWGECPVCGAVAGYIEREKVEKYLERVEAAEKRAARSTPGGK